MPRNIVPGDPVALRRHATERATPASGAETRDSTPGLRDSTVSISRAAQMHSGNQGTYGEDSFVPGTKAQRVVARGSQVHGSDLHEDEIEAIQTEVDETHTPIGVTGSAARGERRPADHEDPSDIDYFSPHPERFDERMLPGLDHNGIREASPDEIRGPKIWFTPGRDPVRIE